jgi:hypothetical protein
MGRSGLRPSRHRLLWPSSLTFTGAPTQAGLGHCEKRASSLLDSACSLSQRTHSASQGRQARPPGLASFCSSSSAVRPGSSPVPEYRVLSFHVEDAGPPGPSAAGVSQHGAPATALKASCYWLSAEPLRIRPCATDKRSRRCCLSLSSQQRTLRGYVRRAGLFKGHAGAAFL